MGIPFIDLQRQYREIQNEVEAAVIRVMRGGQYILGPEVSALEEELASYTGTRYCVSCASGTDALLIALMAAEIGRGDAVFVPTFTFFATAEVVSLLGATPVFVDSEPDTFNLSVESLALELDRLARGARRSDDRLRPRAIIPVDLFGVPADYERIHELAAAHGLLVIEDAAQSFGATYRGRRCGALSEIGCTSFFPAKPLGGFGDGGALFTDNPALDTLFRSIRVHGEGADRYDNVRVGINGRLDALQAAVLRIKLKLLPRELGMRQEIAARYTALIRRADLGLRCPEVPAGCQSAWAQYTLLARDSRQRDSMLEKLKRASVPTAVYYPKPLHLQKAFASLGYRTGDFPCSEELASRAFSVPMHPYLEEAEARMIVDAML